MSPLNRYKSFFLHLRPDSYSRDAIGFRTTFYLGFVLFFLLVLETVTGFLLMAYYSPTPTTAFSSIIRLHTEVPFGWLMRDLHRLGGELMIIAVLLHMLRIILAGSYRGSTRAMTWLSGMGLLLCTLFLAFSGYLLPWDQLAYWAVTIGTSLLEKLPSIGSPLVFLLKGGGEIGNDGLLRFYLLHIAIVPGCMILLAAAHYYRVARLHRSVANLAQKKNGKKRISFFPDLFSAEIAASLFLLTILILICTFLYDAPLGTPANPSHTPSETQAPWYFLWLQGALKLGDSIMMGVYFPALLLFIFSIFPFADRTKSKSRPSFVGRTVFMTSFIILLFILSYIGLPGATADNKNPNDLLLEFAPEENLSIFHALGYENLPQGIYETEAIDSVNNKALEDFMSNFSNKLDQIAPAESSLKAVVIVEDWQAELKKITIRIIDELNQNVGGSGYPQRIVYVHKDSH